ncbi:hypothetical protein N9N67_07335 [Bacteriovoracaceae bacterium]|nr:hypothetical protein [Bacteriovoracaceae bacterium]
MKQIILFFFIIFNNLIAQSPNYQIGDAWSRERVDLPKNVIGHFGSQHLSLIQVIGRYNGGTITYLGKFNGIHLAITNHHVCSKPVFCIGQYIRFTNTPSPSEEYSIIWGKSKNLIFTIDEIETSLIEVSFSEPEEEKIMVELAAKNKYQWQFEFEQELLVLGYGIHRNSFRGLSIAYDNDCRIFSPANFVKKIKDPDQVNPVSYKVWSVSIGCDTSHGDSGALVINRKTGEFIGIIWTGKVPKGPMTRNSKVLATWRTNESYLIWQELTYMVPFYKIKEIINLSPEVKKLPYSIKLSIMKWLQD